MDELIELEKAGWASLCNGTGDSFYGDLMTDDGVMVMANGAVMTRKEVVDALAESPPWASYEIDDVQTVPVGDDAAALVYVGTGHRGRGQPAVRRSDDQRLRAARRRLEARAVPADAQAVLTDTLTGRTARRWLTPQNTNGTEQRWMTTSCSGSTNSPMRNITSNVNTAVGHSPTRSADRLDAVKVSLDQCWDLLRQRRARRESGLDPDDAAVRSETTVEGYQQ